MGAIPKAGHVWGAPKGWWAGRLYPAGNHAARPVPGTCEADAPAEGRPSGPEPPDVRRGGEHERKRTKLIVAPAACRCQNGTAGARSWRPLLSAATAMLRRRPPTPYHACNISAECDLHLLLNTN